MQTKNYFFPANYYDKVGKAISTLKGEQKNVALMTFLGGFRRADLDNLKIQNIDLDTGVIYSTKTKTGLVNGVLSPPMLDVLKMQIGDRTSGKVFLNSMNENASGINSFLKKVFSG